MGKRRGGVKLTSIALSLVLIVLVGCEKKSNTPTATEFEKERAKLMARVQERKARKGGSEAPPPAAVVSKPTGSGASPAGGSPYGGFGSSDGKFSYDPTGKRDPFRSFEWERLAAELSQEIGGPLEQFDVSQLSVIAVVWNTGGARALVQDPSGASYVVGKGTRIGKNSGSVTKIDDNLVVVKETYVDWRGHETMKDIEMRIRRSEGG